MFSAMQRLYFAGLVTIDPAIASPVGFVPVEFDVDFVLKENALSGSLKLLIVCVNTEQVPTSLLLLELFSIILQQLALLNDNTQPHNSFDG